MSHRTRAAHQFKAITAGVRIAAQRNIHRKHRAQLYLFVFPLSHLATSLPGKLSV